MTDAHLKEYIVATLREAGKAFSATYDLGGTPARREEILMTVHVLQAIHWKLSQRNVGPITDMISLGQQVWEYASNEPFMDEKEKEWHDRAFMNSHCQMTCCSVENALFLTLMRRTGQGH